MRAAGGIALGIAAGTLLGVGGYTFVYARGASYLTDNPAACANCHVMQEQFDGWLKSSHRSVAVCNDCHTPHTILGKYATKARNGFWHSFYFTRGGFPEPIHILERDRRITEQTCRSCHRDIVEAIDPPGRRGEPLSCVSCHINVGHLH
jgi:cytochrome c nitrite reductase small subunit